VGRGRVVCVVWWWQWWKVAVWCGWWGGVGLCGSREGPDPGRKGGVVVVVVGRET